MKVSNKYFFVINPKFSGRPEPTTLPPKKQNSNTYTPSSQTMSSMSGGGGNKGGGGPPDPNGMERLPGESDADYVARQTRLRDEAKARMAAKFGGGGMGGVGSGGMGGKDNIYITIVSNLNGVKHQPQAHKTH